MRVGVPLLGVYSPGDSWLHRQRAAPKVAALVVVTVTAVLLRSPVLAAGLLLLAVLLLLSSRVDLRRLVRPLLLLGGVAVGLAAFVSWQQGLDRGVVVICRLLTLALLAWTVSLTTRVSEMLAVLLRTLRPLRRLGVPTERVAMTLALAIRTVPLLMATVQSAQDARLARGRDRSVAALAVPVVVRSARIAEELGDALVARGYDPHER